MLIKLCASVPVLKVYLIPIAPVWINQHCAFDPHIPFASAKESGIGVEWGKEGMQEFTVMQVININKA